MHITCKITISCDNTEKAILINHALDIDNEGYLKSMVKKDTIIATAESENILSLLNTINDFLSCLAVAMDVTCTDSEKQA